MVLHHQHDDVLDLRYQISAGGPGRVGPLARSLMPPPVPLAQFLPVDPLPDVRADRHCSIIPNRATFRDTAVVPAAASSPTRQIPAQTAHTVAVAGEPPGA